ncbi:MAG: hypothetical protein ACFFBD_18075 [Candidatus Hodarchaeota archaeon]
MAPRAFHLFVGFLVYIASFLFYQIRYASAVGIQIDAVWFMAGLIMTLTGAELADYDLLVVHLSHRDILTHSALIPLLFVIPFATISIPADVHTVLFLTIVSPFVIGYGCHLILDLFPPFNYKEMKEEEGVLKATIVLSKGLAQGITGKEIVTQMKGTYLIHLPFRLPIGAREKPTVSRFNPRNRKKRKTFAKAGTRVWLTANAFFSFFLGSIIFLNFLL